MFENNVLTKRESRSKGDGMNQMLKVGDRVRLDRSEKSLRAAKRWSLTQKVFDWYPGSEEPFTVTAIHTDGETANLNFEDVPHWPVKCLIKVAD